MCIIHVENTMTYYEKSTHHIMERKEKDTEMRTQHEILCGIILFQNSNEYSMGYFNKY